MAMESCEPTSLLLSKIKTFDPENASRILGFLLLNGLPEKDLMRLVLGPDSVLQSLIFKAKSQLGLLSNTSCAPISRPTLAVPSPTTAGNGGNGNPFSHSSPRIRPTGDCGFDLPRNPSSPSPVAPWPSSVFPSSNNPMISPKDGSSSLLSFENIRSGSVSVAPFSNQSNGNGPGTGAVSVSRSNSGDLIDENQLGEYLSFLNESSKSDDSVDPRVELGFAGGNSTHRRSFSASDACFGSEDGGGFVAGGCFRPCLYFARGFCKNGSNCKFVHVNFPENFDGSGPVVGSPSKFDGFDQRDEIMRLKAVEQQRLAAMSQFGPRNLSPYNNKYLNLLLQQQNESQRSAAAAALMVQEELHRFSRLRAERNDFMMMGLADKSNSASRQIYLTFPADSSFKDEDVSEYFSTYGPVQDVRIPYQQKRMFGFVTFVFAETVKLILQRGNPHFICDSRVLVKPYKEKGKVPDRRQQFQHQQLERGDFSGCLSPSELDDLHLGTRSFYTQEMLRRKLEQEAELQQAIELQGRRLINLHLPEFKDDQYRHHQRSLSVGAPPSLPPQPNNPVSHEVAEDNKDSPDTFADAELQVSQEKDTALVHDNDIEKCKESSNPKEINDCQSVENVLSGFVASTKSAGDPSSFFSTPSAEVEESNGISATTISENNASLPTSSASDVGFR